MVAISEAFQSKLSANIPQARFLSSKKKHRAFVAGFGSGKTYVGCIAMCQRFWQNPKANQGYFAPTYGQIRDIFYPTIDEVAHAMGLRVEIREGNHEAHLYSGKWYRGTTLCRSMDKPGTIVGFKISAGLADEIDLLATDKARLAWNKIIARLRWPTNLSTITNGIDLTSTPEGFKFIYSKFVQELAKTPSKRKTHELIKASTYDNQANLPSDYIATLLESYNEALISAYLRGDFVNLTSGTVYKSFDRVRHNSTETAKEGERLHVGMDFNVTNMSATIAVQREKAWHFVKELIGVYDTPAMVALIQDKFPKHSIAVYPDSSGKNRKTNNASETDISILQQAGFSVYYEKSNPAVKDRINSVNRAYEKDILFVNTEQCPELTRCHEQQAYDKNGEPDKQSNTDHLNDAAGYFVTQKMPVVKPVTQLKSSFAH